MLQSLIKFIRYFALLMNISIASVLLVGLWTFLARDDIYADPSWIIWLPIITLLLIGPPLFTTWSIFSDRSRNMRIIFLSLNFISLMLLIASIFADKWITDSVNTPFNWHSLGKLFLILGAPFLVNVVTLVFLITNKRSS